MTNRSLTEAIKSGQLREDLYYRLNVFPIHLSPLRDRLDDIPILAEHCLGEASQRLNKELAGFGEGVIEMLQGYSWPGNVRELENEIYRAAALVEEGLPIQIFHFSAEIALEAALIQETISGGTDYAETVKQFQQRLIQRALDACGGNHTQAAQRLGMDRSNLRCLMRRLGIR